MILKCLIDCQVTAGNKEYVFENIDDSPNIYETSTQVGKAAVATGKCQEIVVDDDHPYDGPVPELPIVHPLPPQEVKAAAPAPAKDKSKKKTGEGP
jgi:hypothetical protein